MALKRSRWLTTKGSLVAPVGCQPPRQSGSRSIDRWSMSGVNQPSGVPVVGACVLMNGDWSDRSGEPGDQIGFDNTERRNGSLSVAPDGCSRNRPASTSCERTNTGCCSLRDV